MDLITGETIAIDSFKIRAQNSLKNNFNQKKIDRHIEYIYEKVDDFLQQLDSGEPEEGKQLEIKQKINTQLERREKYKNIDLRRLMSIFELNELKMRLQSLVFYFFFKYGSYRAIVSN